jgi:hypothetical protein
MNSASLLMAITLSAGVSVQPGLGMPYTGPGRDIIVATVSKVSPKTGAVELTVNEVLRGDPKVDRRKALWLAPVDLSEGKLQSPLTGDPVPAVVGKKYILSGAVEKKAFVLAPYWRYHYSAENLTAVRKYIAREDAAAILYQFREVFQATKMGVRRSFWRHSMSEAQIRSQVNVADFVVIGKIVSEGFNGGPTVSCLMEVSEVLKGKWRSAQHNNYLTISVPTTVHGLMNREAPYLLFLTERGMMLGTGGGYYPLVSPKDGVMIADSAAVQAAKDAVLALPPTPERPVVVMQIQHGSYQNWTHFCRTKDQLAAAFDKAVEKRFTVLQSRDFSLEFYRLTERDHGFIAKTMRERVPGASMFLAVQLDQPADKPLKVVLTALSLDSDRGSVLLTREFQVKDQADMEAKAAEVMARLVKPAPK